MVKSVSDLRQREGDERYACLIETLARMAAGETELRIPLSGAGDQLDAVAYGVNILAEELTFALANLARERESAQRASDSKTTFLAHLSHEFRTPLTAIVGFSELLERGNLSAEQRHDFVGRIRANGRSLRKLVDQLLDLSKIEAGELALEPQSVDLRKLFVENLNSLESTASAKGVRLVCRIVDDVPRFVCLDRLRLWQVTNNLVGNAIKFSDAGDVTVSVGAEGDDLLVVDVEDRGIGIEPSVRPALFEPFAQGMPSIGRRYGGTGLGLAVSRSLCRAMGGELILVRSAPGKGSLFRATLRFAPSQPCPQQPAPAEAPATQPLRGLRVLLAEDAADVSELLRAFLTGKGATVICCRDGGEAVARAEGADVILMDLAMPFVDGVEATRLLRARGCAAPVLALTARALLTEKETCLASGFTDYLAKPVDWELLITRILQHARPNQA